MARDNLVNTSQPIVTSVKRGDEEETILQIRQGKKEQEPEYIKLYLKDLMYLHGLQGRHVSVLLGLLKRANYADVDMPMCVVLAPEIRKRICEEAGWTSVGTFNNALDDLVKGNVVKRVGRSIVQLNPNLFGKGQWKDVTKIRLTVEYGPTKNRTFGATVKEEKYWHDVNKED